MIRVQVRPNEPLEAALRRFKRQCNFAGIFRLAKKSSVYEKPSERRRREARERIRNIQRQIRKAKMARSGRRRRPKRGGPSSGAGGYSRRPESDSQNMTATASEKTVIAPVATPVASQD